MNPEGAGRFYPVIVRKLLLAFLFPLISLSCATDDGRDLAEPTFDPPSAPTTIEGAFGTLPKFTNGAGGLSIRSTSFEPGAPIPSVHSAAGTNTSPHLSIVSVPAGVVELAVVMTNPDSDNAIHWIVTGIAPTTLDLAEGALPGEADEQTSHFGVENWIGPNTPAGEMHHYVFTVYGLEEPFEFNSDFTTNDVVALIKQRSLVGATATLMGTHQG
jgi:Raf kinase inhibitor-like YbhB/YbcL family protein